MNARSQSPLATASVTCPELSYTCKVKGNFSAAENPRIKSTVTPFILPRSSLIAKKADAAGAATTPPRNVPVGANCLRSSEFVIAPRLARVPFNGYRPATNQMFISAAQNSGWEMPERSAAGCEQNQRPLPGDTNCTPG